MENPLFSVVIPLYNKVDCIVETLQSVLNQTLLPEEIIVVDDGSTDNSNGAVKGFIEKSEKVLNIQLLRQQNGGVSLARNRGIELAKYPYIAFLDSDDLWKPPFLQRVAELIKAYPDAGAYASGYEYLDEIGNIRSPFFENVPEKQGIIDYFRAIRGENPVCSSAVVIRKKVFEQVGMFPVGETMGEDIDTWCRIALSYSIAWTNENLAQYRITTQNRACGKRENLLKEHCIVKTLAKAVARESDPEKMELLQTYLESIYMLQARYRLLADDIDGFKKEIARLSFSRFYRKKLYYLQFLPNYIAKFLVKRFFGK